MKARYIDPQIGGIEVALIDGETLGTVSGPATIFVGMDAGNREHQALMALVSAGKVAIAPFAAAAPSAVPAAITDRQFFTQLALDGFITQAEAEATSSGEMPARLMQILDRIEDPRERFKSRMLLKNATTFERAHPLVAYIGQTMGWSEADRDELWINASNL